MEQLAIGTRHRGILTVPPRQRLCQEEGRVGRKDGNATRHKREKSDGGGLRVGGRAEIALLRRSLKHLSASFEKGGADTNGQRHDEIGRSPGDGKAGIGRWEEHRVLGGREQNGGALGRADTTRQPSRFQQ